MTLSGTYEITGGFDGHALYAKQTIDPNANWWIFYFDAQSNGWEFTYFNKKVSPGFKLSERAVSSFQNNESGQSPDFPHRFLKFLKIFLKLLI